AVEVLDDVVGVDLERARGALGLDDGPLPDALVTPEDQQLVAAGLDRLEQPGLLPAGAPGDEDRRRTLGVELPAPRDRVEVDGLEEAVGAAAIGDEDRVALHARVAVDPDPLHVIIRSVSEMNTSRLPSVASTGTSSVMMYETPQSSSVHETGPPAVP